MGRSMSGRTTPTIKDIAVAAGVTHQAVSIALSDRPGVSVKRRQQIRDLAREMGYYPHAASQMLNRAGRGTGQWGLLVATTPRNVLPNSGMGIAVNAFAQYCCDHDQRYVVEYYPAEKAEGEFQPPHQVAGRLVDGSLVIGDVGDRLRQWLDDQAPFPWVSMLEPARFCVISAEHRTLYAVLSELVQMGHRRIACPSGEVKHLTHRLRLAAYRHAVRHFGLKIPASWQAYLVDDSTERYRWAHQLLEAKNRPTAVVCSGDAMARTLILVAAELGMRVPRDLSVVVYSSPAEGSAGYPQLEGIHTNFLALTETAVDLLKQRINGEDDRIQSPRRWILPERFHGNSIAPPRDR